MIAAQRSLGAVRLFGSFAIRCEFEKTIVPVSGAKDSLTLDTASTTMGGR